MMQCPDREPAAVWGNLSCIPTLDHHSWSRTMNKTPCADYMAVLRNAEDSDFIWTQFLVCFCQFSPSWPFLKTQDYKTKLVPFGSLAFFNSFCSLAPWKSMFIFPRTLNQVPGHSKVQDIVTYVTGFHSCLLAPPFSNPFPQLLTVYSNSYFLPRPLGQF